MLCFCSVDATEEPIAGPRLGRLVNHGEKRELNAVMKVIETTNEPALCLFAIKNIAREEEILYDYGVSNLPWKVSCVAFS